MNRLLTIKRYILLSSTSLLLVACGNNVDSETEESVEPETVEVESEEAESEEESSEAEVSEENEEHTEAEENESIEESEGQEDTENVEDTTLTEDEAIDLARNYVSESEEIDTEGLSWTVQEGDEGEYLIQLFTFGPEGEEQQHTQTIGWYVVNKDTHEVTNRMDEGTDVYISEIVSMSEESRENHLRNLAANEENLESHVFNQLLLPGVHENTSEYEGRVNSGDTVRLEVSSTGRTIEPDVDSEGYFIANLEELQLAEGDILSLSITGENYSQEQAFELLVHSEHEGMETIRVRE